LHLVEYKPRIHFFITADEYEVGKCRCVVGTERLSFVALVDARITVPRLTRAVCHILYEFSTTMNSVLHDMIDKKLEEEAGLWEHGPPPKTANLKALAKRSPAPVM
jgi:hypothetical protein